MTAEPVNSNWALTEASRKERDFRWNRTYELMDSLGLAGILVFGADRSDRYDAGQYLFRDRRYQHFFMPRHGEPVMVAFSSQVAGQHFMTKERGLETWIEDIRVGRAPELFPELAADYGIASERLGVIGIGTGSPFYPGGWVSPDTWNALKAGLPNAELVDITRDFAYVMATRSEEDLENLAIGCAAADEAILAMMEIARPGVTETALYAEATSTMLRRGLRVTWMLLQSGIDNFAFGEPTWLTRPEAPRALESSDVVRAEIFPNYAELNGHVNMTFAVGPVSADLERCAAVAEECYAAGREKLKPGVAFSEVCAVMEAPVRAAGMWHLTPQFGLLNPLLVVGAPGYGIREAIPNFAASYPHADEKEKPLFDFEIEAGMTFGIQPDAWIGRNGVRVGGMAAAVEGGCREFSSVSTRFNRVDY